MPSVEMSAQRVVALFWNALTIVEQWRALRQEEIAVFERACPGGEGEWEHVESLPIECYPLEVSPPPRDLLIERNRIRGARERLFAQWKSLRNIVCHFAAAMVRETRDPGISERDLFHLIAFPSDGTDAESAGTSRMLTATIRRAESEVIDARAADLARQFAGKTKGDILISFAEASLGGAPGGVRLLDSGKAIARAAGAKKNNSAFRTEMSHLKHLGAIAEAGDGYTLTSFGWAIVEHLRPDLRPALPDSDPELS